MSELNINDRNDEDSTPESSNLKIEVLPEAPIFEATYSRSQIGGLPPEVLATLSKADPLDVLDFMKTYHEGERKLQEMNIQNQQIALEKQHILELKREETRSQSSVNTKELSKFAMGIFATLFAGVLFYAHVAGDKALPDSIIKLMTGALAGGGGVTLLNQASQKDRKKE